MAARKKKSPRAKPKAGAARRASRAKSRRTAARPKARSAARPKSSTPAAGVAASEGVVYSDVRREAAMRRFLRQPG